jgi:predicted dehydrogenase
MRIGIIGGGFGVDGHLTAISGLPDAKVVAVADSGSGRVLARLLDPSLYCPTWRDMLSTAVDAVCIVTPPATHQEMVLELVDAGKQVLCEKPLGMNPLQSRQMAEAVTRANMLAAVSFQYRFEPGFQALKKLLDDKRIGDLKSVECIWLTSSRRDPRSAWTWRNDAVQGGGVIGAFLSHLVDLLHWLTGYRVQGVDASTEILVPRRPRGDGVMVDVTAEDMVRARLDLMGGVWADCHVSNCHPEALGMRVELMGSTGKLVYSHAPPFTAEMQQVHLHVHGDKSRLLFNARDVLGLVSGDTRLPALRALLECFIQTTGRDNISDLPTFDDGWAVQRVLHAVRQSAASRDRVPC